MTLKDKALQSGIPFKDISKLYDKRRNNKDWTDEDLINWYFESRETLIGYYMKLGFTKEQAIRIREYKRVNNIADKDTAIRAYTNYKKVQDIKKKDNELKSKQKEIEKAERAKIKTFADKCRHAGISEDKLDVLNSFKRRKSNEGLTDEEIIQKWIKYQKEGKPLSERQELFNRGFNEIEVKKISMYRKSHNIDNIDEAIAEWRQLQEKETQLDIYKKLGVPEDKLRTFQNYRTYKENKSLTIEEVYHKWTEMHKIETFPDKCLKAGILKEKISTVNSYKHRLKLSDEEAITRWLELQSKESFNEKCRKTLREFNIEPTKKILNSLKNFRVSNKEIGDVEVICIYLQRIGINCYINIFGNIVRKE